MLWGKIEGLESDYYIAYGLNYKGKQLFPEKKFYWTSSKQMTFTSLPEPLKDQSSIIDQI
jgi:hypothetical protein